MILSSRFAFAAAAVLASAAPCLAQDAAPASDAEIARAYEDYLAERGENLDACFENLPPMRGPAEEARFAAGEGTPPPEPKRLVVAIDASGSMAGRIGGTRKMEAAKEATAAFLTQAPADLEVGLIAFGHTGSNEESGKAESCRGVETVYDVGAANRPAIEAALSSFEPVGWTPLAAAIEAAGTALEASEIAGEQVVYVVSDGEETCGGDPVAAARRLRESDVKAVVNVIGFDLAEADRAQLGAVAEAGGGTFTEASSADELRSVVGEIARRSRNIREIVGQRAQAAAATVANNAATAQTVVKARACFASRSVRESANIIRHFGFKGPLEIREGVADRLAVRHAEYEARLNAYVEQAEGARDAANSDIGGARQKAEDAFEKAYPD